MARIKSILIAQYEKNDLNSERKTKIIEGAELINSLNEKAKTTRYKEIVRLETSVLAEVADTPRYDFDELKARIKEDREADIVQAAEQKQQIDSLIDELKRTGKWDEFQQTKQLEDLEQDAMLKLLADRLGARELDKQRVAAEKGAEDEVPNPEEILDKLQPSSQTEKSFLKAIRDTLRSNDEEKIAEYMNLPKGEFEIKSLPLKGTPCLGGTLVRLKRDECYIRLDYPVPQDDELPIVLKLERNKIDGLSKATLGDVFLITGNEAEQKWEFEKLQRLPKLVVPDEVTRKLFEDNVIGRGNPPASTIPKNFEIKKPSEINLSAKGKGTFSAYSSQPDQCQALLTSGSDEVRNGIIIEFEHTLNIPQGQPFTGTITKKNGRTEVSINGVKMTPNIATTDNNQRRNSRGQ